MPKNVVLSVMSRDRVGIIAAVTRSILELEGNINAISQTVLQGYFTIILTITFASDHALDAIQRAVEGSEHQGEWKVSVLPRDPKAARPVVAEGDVFVVTINGKDRLGIIHRITQYLAGHGINIVDLSAYSEGDEFVLIGQVKVPRERDIRQIQIDLESLWPDGSVLARVQHENVFAATNEIDFHPAHPGGAAGARAV